MFTGNEMLKIIVESGGGEDVNTRNLVGRTPLHEVAQIGDEKMLKTMWKLNVILLSCGNILKMN